MSYILRIMNYTYELSTTVTIITNAQIYVRRMYELNQRDTVCRLMFISLDISISQIRIFPRYKKEYCRGKAWYMVHFVAYRTIILYYVDSHSLKSFCIQSNFGSYFPVFSPNAGKYGPE